MFAPKSTPNFGDVKIALTIVDISRKIAKPHNYKYMSHYDCLFAQYLLSLPLRHHVHISRIPGRHGENFSLIRKIASSAMESPQVCTSKLRPSWACSRPSTLTIEPAQSLSESSRELLDCSRHQQIHPLASFSNAD